MEWCLVAFLLVVVYLVTQGLRLLFAETDLVLQWCELFGNSPASLSEKVVWITGASSGLGEALSYELAEAGCCLVLSARRQERLNDVKACCIERSRMKADKILVLPLDMLAFDTHKQAVETVLKYFKKIDILINNAGRSQRALWERTSLNTDQEMLKLNVLGPLSLTKAVLPHMLDRRVGHIVCTSSVAGKFGAPGLGSYSCSKHALHGAFNCLRNETHDRNIHVTMVVAGPFFSEALIHAFTESTEKNLGLEMKPGEKRMHTKHFAHHMVVAIANKLDEVWISMHPELAFVYINQYFPAIAQRLAAIVARKRLQKIREGKTDLHS
ncbi:hypothetical protein ACJMK2_037892 [Sinanodonta woodiana]|uniref:Dehydrogenase/reductase SDR family member 7 n=1 Tax=Sinanodonta woodiana TaxID=1069815 RepID=A0ABD3WLV3_SINWO